MALKRSTKTFLLAGPLDEKLSKTDIIAINRDLENIFSCIQILDARTDGGLTTTQTFKDGAGATKTFHLTNGVITSIT